MNENTLEARMILSSKLTYITLISSIIPKSIGGIMNSEVRTVIEEVGKFINTDNEIEFLSKEKQITEFINSYYFKLKEAFPPLINLRQIKKQFDSFGEEGINIYSVGIEYGWLQKVIDCSRIPYPRDMPYHTRIGLGAHSNSIKVEEEFLVRDACFMLIQAEESFRNMYEYRHSLEKNNSYDEELAIKIIGDFNQTVATYSRLSVLSFYSFIEAFINSIGYDYYLRNSSTLEEANSEILNGKKKGNFISLEYKIEKFQEIIRADKKSIVKTLDKSQLKEPFATLISHIKEIRGSSVHYSPLKERIWRNPTEWIDIARKTSQLCLECGLQFWKACYPNSQAPLYLHSLDFSENIDIARERLRNIGEIC